MPSIKTFAAAAALMALGTPAAAQTWPTRPVTMVVPFSAGGPGDVFGRIIASRLAEVLGQTIVIENVGAGGGMAGAARVAKATPDGYQFVYGNIGTHAQSQTLYKHRLYNAATDFSPVALITEASTMLTVRKTLPVNNLAEFIAYTKANRDKMQFGSGGAASPSHLACALVNAAIEVNVTHVPYRGGGQSIQDMIAGHIDYQCAGSAVSIPVVQNGQVKAIAVLSRERSPSLPTLPTAHEQGLTNLDASTWTGLFFPKGTPKAIVQKLHAAAVATMETPSVQRRLGELGATVVAPERRSPEYLQTFVVQEIDRWSVVIKAAGISVE
jgi:tripartite-type tricarboxylate transporter receptor subunit TctC